MKNAPKRSRRFKNRQKEQNETRKIEKQKVILGCTKKQLAYISAVTALGIASIIAIHKKNQIQGKEQSKTEYVQPKEQVDKKTAAVLRAVQSIKESGTADVEWFHPEQHEKGGMPIDPIIYIANLHEGVLRHTTRAAQTHQTHVLLDICLQAGVQKFGFEGYDKGSIEGIIHNQMNPEEFRSFLQNPNNFYRLESQFSSDLTGKYRVERLFVGYATALGADCVGLENVDTDGKEYERILVNNIARSFSDDIFRAGTSGPPAFEDNFVVFKNSQQRFSARLTEFAMHESAQFLEFLAHERIKEDDEHVIKNATNCDVIVFGAAHRESLQQQFTRSSRSIAVVTRNETSTNIQELESNLLGNIKRYEGISKQLQHVYSALKRSEDMTHKDKIQRDLQVYKLLCNIIFTTKISDYELDESKQNIRLKKSFAELSVPQQQCVQGVHYTNTLDSNVTINVHFLHAALHLYHTRLKEAAELQLITSEELHEQVSTIEQFAVALQVLILSK